MKNFLALLLVFATLFTLSACRTSGTGGDETGVGDETLTEMETGNPQAADGIPVVADGKTVNIVYPMDDFNIKTLANNVANKIETLTGIKPTVKDDWVAIDKEQDSSTYEILIGRVDYSEYKTAMQSLHYGEAGVLAVGNKICVLSTKESDLQAAVLKLYVKLEEAYHKASGTIYFEKNLHIVTEGEEMLRAIPEFAGKMLSGIYDCTRNGYQALFEDMTKAEFTSYCETVESAGYTLYTKNDSWAYNSKNTNQFLTYITEEHVLTLLYTPSVKTLRVIVESRADTALAGLESENQYTKNVCSTLLTQIGVGYAQGHQNGMCYVMRLEDGSFLIVDGGHAAQVYADNIYKVMREQAPDPDNIVIAAWIFTHTHGDHVGVFPYFAALYNNRVKVERFIYNLPVSSAFVSSEWFDGNTGLEQTVKMKFPNAEVNRTHPGQIFYIRNAKINILYTADLYASKKIDYFNTASMVFTIEADGVKTMILGDIGSDGASVISSIYNGSILKSDVIQVAHHGILSSPSTLYSTINPEYVLWPLATTDYKTKEPLEKYVGYKNGSHNNFFTKNADATKYVEGVNLFLAEDDVVVLTFGENKVEKAELFADVSAYVK